MGEKGKSVGVTKPKKKLTFALPVDSNFASNSAIPAASSAPKAVPHAVTSSTKAMPSVALKAGPARPSSSDAAVPVALTLAKAVKASKFKPAVPPPAKPAKSTRSAKPVVVSANPLLPPAKISLRPAPSTSVPSNMNIPSVTITKSKPATVALDTEDSFDDEQFELRPEDLGDLSDGSVGNGIEGGSGEDLGGQGDVERVHDEEQPEGMPSWTDLKSYIAQKRTHSAARSSPEPEKVSKRSKRVEAPAAPDVSMNVEAIFRTVFGHPSGSNDQASSSVPRQPAQIDTSNMVQSTVLFLTKDSTVTLEAQGDWDTRVKIMTSDGRTMAVDRNTYNAFQELITSAAEDLTSGSGNQNQGDPDQSMGDSEQEQSAPPAPENHLPDDHRTPGGVETDLRATRNLGPQGASTHGKGKMTMVICSFIVEMILQEGTVSLGPGLSLQREISSLEVTSLSGNGKVMLSDIQVIVTLDLPPLPRQRIVTEKGDTGPAIVGLLIKVAPDRQGTIRTTRGLEMGALPPRTDTVIEALGHHLTDGVHTLAPALALALGPETAGICTRGLVQGIIDTGTLLLAGTFWVQGVLGAGWLSPIGLGALTTKAVRAAKEKAFSKPGGFQLDKETGLVIQSVRMVDSSGDKDLTVRDFLEASSLFVRVAAEQYEKLFDIINSKEDLREQWPAYAEYLNQAFIKDVYNRHDDCRQDLILETFHFFFVCASFQNLVVLRFWYSSEVRLKPFLSEQMLEVWFTKSWRNSSHWGNKVGRQEG
ncbi:hypothetical protein C8J56DRAFT_879523 [Mycena floridula]|nr:hypothetical protein C8J56DRAFT_879523 [Mycena floridula]